MGSRGGSSLPPPSLNSCTLSQNKTGNLGGGFFLSFTSSNIENCIIAGNTAGRDGDNVFGTIGNELGNNILSGDSVLAPLDDYGGPTLTMPPLPGSPALDTGGAADPGGSDQRGFPRFANGALDIGAVEIQGSDDTDNILSIAWPTDVDNDGVSFGVEYAIGSNFNGPDPERDFTFGNDIGEFRFGRVDPFPANVILRVVRSLDLASDDFTALVSITDSGFEILTDSDRLVESDEGDFFIFDDAVPRSPSAFYRLEADFNP